MYAGVLWQPRATGIRLGRTSHHQGLTRDLNRTLKVNPCGARRVGWQDASSPRPSPPFLRQEEREKNRLSVLGNFDGFALELSQREEGLNVSW